LFFISLWPVMRHGAGPRLWALAAAAVLVLPALVHPRLLGGPFRAWMKLGHMLGWVNTRVILGVFFYALLTPTGLVMRLFRADPMRRKPDPGAGSYRLERQPRSADHLRHQF
jgi:hypothetical protein